MRRKDPKAQKALYDLYKDQLFAVALRYINSYQDAEDVFINAFYKILTKIDTYKNTGSFEGWMRRIVANESLMYLRKNANLGQTVELLDYEVVDINEADEENITYEQIMEILDEIPIGYRTVFNLYVFEDYKHREIADMLGISINTSKSQYIMAKKRILEVLNQKGFVRK